METYDLTNPKDVLKLLPAGLGVLAFVASSGLFIYEMGQLGEELGKALHEISEQQKAPKRDLKFEEQKLEQKQTPYTLEIAR